MAYIIRSNKAVVDNNGKFPYVTPFGETNKYLAAYYNNMLSAGYTFSQAEFDALNTFTKALIDQEIINSIVEIIPLIGGANQAATLTKLKFLNSAKMTPINTSAANFGDKGLKFDVYKTSGADAFEIGFTDLDIWNKYSGFGYTAYFKFDNSDTRTSGRTVFGLSANSADISNNSIGLNILRNGVTQSRFMNSSPTNTVIADFESPQLYSSFTKWNAIKNTTLRYTESNGSVLTNSSSNVLLNTPNANSSFNLGAFKVAATPTAPTLGFHGKIRFLLFTNGELTLAQLSTLNSSIMTLLTSLGKTTF